MRKMMLAAAILAAAFPAMAGDAEEDSSRPIPPLADELGISLVCHEGFLHARNGGGYVPVTQSVPAEGGKYLITVPIRCAKNAWFPAGSE